MIILAEQHSLPVKKKKEPLTNAHFTLVGIGEGRLWETSLHLLFSRKSVPKQTGQGRYLLWMSNFVLICLTSFMLYAPIGRWCLWVASLTNRDPHSAPSPVLTAKQSQRTGPVSISCHSDTQTLPCYRCGDWWTPSGTQEDQWFHTPACTQTYTPAAWIILHCYYDLCSTTVVKRLFIESWPEERLFEACTRTNIC